MADPDYLRFLATISPKELSEEATSMVERFNVLLARATAIREEKRTETSYPSTAKMQERLDVWSQGEKMAIELLAIFEEGTRREEAGEDIRLEADMSAIKRWNDEMAMKELSRAMKGTGL